MSESGISTKIDAEVAAAGNAPVTDQQVAQAVNAVTEFFDRAAETPAEYAAKVKAFCAAHDAMTVQPRTRETANARYAVYSSINSIFGTRFQVRDTNHSHCYLVAEFYDIGHREGDESAWKWVIDEAIGWQNAQTMCQILNVTEEASRGK